MPRQKRVDLTTGDGVIKYAKGRGADVTPQSHGNFTAIETPAGKMHIRPGKEKLDKPTQANVRRWLKLLGLLVILAALALVDYLWGYLGLPTIF